MAHAGGRPRKDIDYEAAAKLAQIQCTQEEIAHILDLSVRKLQNDQEFMRIYKKGIETGKSSLRRLQWKAANEGNATMMVWLGKQYLKQTDKAEIDNKAEVKIMVTVEGDEE